MRIQLLIYSITILIIHCLLVASGEILDYTISEFNQNNYDIAVESLIKNFEKSNNMSIAPGHKGTIALRIYTYSGPGLCTPPELILALSKSLTNRGFKTENIFIIGDSKYNLLKCGYISSRINSDNATFHNMPVFWIDDEQFYSDQWAYKSSLTSTGETIINQNILSGINSTVKQFTKSYLPTMLMFGVDYWINIPTYCGHSQHGVVGSIIQGAIFNISNHKRFLDNPINCAKIAPQIYAIPELSEHCLFSITSLERFQYVDTLSYNENYIQSLPHILLSNDPIALDSLCTKIVNYIKKKHNINNLQHCPNILKYGERLNLGTTQYKMLQIK